MQCSVGRERWARMETRWVGEPEGAHSDTQPENIKSSPFIKLQGRENIEQVKLGES